MTKDEAPKSSPLCSQSTLIEARRAENRGRGGRGVFALADIPSGTVIERVPVLLLPKSQVFGDSEVARQMAHISWYVFDWTGLTKRPYVALALGYGSIYNHSFTPNAGYNRLPPDMIEFVACRDIAAGEEVLINYHGQADDRRDVYFEVKP